MIIWSRFGFLVAVFVFGCSIAANLITNSVTGGDAYWEAHQWPFGVSLFASAILCWGVGLLLSRRGSRTLIDSETGEQVVDSPSHTLFFVKMHWWGPILAILGIVVIGKDLMG
ncbi:MAG: hypothetical protein CME06_15965 [Gemmatimonadetes bacterium]|nr:hypothetical protein [Gemmatimonadota bacterium]